MLGTISRLDYFASVLQDFFKSSETKGRKKTKGPSGPFVVLHEPFKLTVADVHGHFEAEAYIAESRSFPSHDNLQVVYVELW